MIWVFDQDGTLYPRASTLFGAIRERTLAWVGERLSLDNHDAAKLVSGLPARHPHPYDGFGSLGLTIADYHTTVFDPIEPRDHVSADPRLRALLASLDGPVHVVTLASRSYSYRLQTVLGVRDMVSRTWVMSELPAHDKAAAYSRILEEHGASPGDLCVAGDSLAIDVEPALRLGARAYLIGETARADISCVKDIFEVPARALRGDNVEVTSP